MLIIKNLNVMDKVLKEFLDERKRKHLEHLGLYKNYDEQVNEIQNEIQNKIEKLQYPLHDLNNLESLIHKIQSKKYEYEECEPSDFLQIDTLKNNFSDIYDDVNVLANIFNSLYSGSSIIGIKNDITQRSFEHPQNIRNQETEEEAYDFIVSVQKEYIKSIVKLITKIQRKYSKEPDFSPRNKVLIKVNETLKKYVPINFDQIKKLCETSDVEFLNKIRSVYSVVADSNSSIGTIDHNEFVVNGNYISHKWDNDMYTLLEETRILSSIFFKIQNIYYNHESFIVLKREMKKNNWIGPQNNEETEKDAYDFIVSVQKEYIKSIMESINVLREKYSHLSFFKAINNILTKVYDSLSNYIPVKLEQISMRVTKIDELNKERVERMKYYKSDYGHWYSTIVPKCVIEISPSDYDELCKKYPPYLMDVKGYVQRTYENGYDKGHKNGYDEGYNNGYDEGYRNG